MNTILIDHNTAQHPQSLLFQSPDRVVKTYKTENISDSISQLESLNNEGYYLAGFFSYELGYFFEKKLEELLPKKRRFPLLWFGAFKKPEILSEQEVKAWLINKSTANKRTPYNLSKFIPGYNQTDYNNSFLQALSNIQSGDIYQLNLTFQTRFQFSGCPFSLYQDLKQKQKMSHGSLLYLEDLTVLSASPEHFLSIENNIANTTPMKGTVKRGPTFNKDHKLKHWLKEDVKSRAENLMIVDLMRNDLGRISEIGSVKVQSLFDVETYPTLHQLTSSVSAKLQPELRILDLLQALFPPGSITGAPKVRAMQLINQLEQGERGIYTGTIGYFEPRKNKQNFPKTYFNVAIRTLTLWPDQNGQIGIGSGVVSDSTPDDEYNECLLKMKFAMNDYPEFQLIETFAFTKEQGFLYYDYHMERLSKSADYFGFQFDLKRIKEQLSGIKDQLSSRSYMVRLLLSEDGTIEITSKEFTLPSPGKIMRFTISDNPMHSENIFLYHKTTNRSFYDDEHKIQTQKYDCDEVIFLNEKNQITEGSRTNIFVETQNGLITPQIECGLLAGTLRASLLEEGKVKEGIINLDVLKASKNIYLGNSVRGLLKAELIN